MGRRMLLNNKTIDTADMKHLLSLHGIWYTTESCDMTFTHSKCCWEHDYFEDNGLWFMACHDEGSEVNKSVHFMS